MTGPEFNTTDGRVAVLVIDDDRKLCRLIAEYLEPMGYAVSAAHTGPEGVKTREQLLEEIRDRNYDVFDRSIDVHISALRRKLGDDSREPRFIKTVRAAGYMLIHPGGGEWHG